MKKLLLVLSLAVCGTPAYAAVITSNVTGADMAGINVTAYFVGGGSETATWITTSTDGSIAYQEGYAGGAFGTGWSLSQQGDTLGQFGPGGQLLGVWTLNNASGNSLMKIAIDALMADIVFDNMFGAEETPGSGPGRPFTSGPANAPGSVVYSDLYSAPDLYGSLTLDWGVTGFASGNTFQFMADTDAIPEPATVLLFAAGLLGLASTRTKRRLPTIKSEV